MRPRARRRLARRLGRWLLSALALWLSVTLGAVLLLRFVPPPTTAFMLQRTLEAERQGRRDFAPRYRWRPLSELSPHVALAVVSAEDQRFFDHHGFDFEQIKRAVGAHLQGARLRGASTLSQQLAKNLFLWESRSLARKALEVYFTLLLEACWPKRRILEVYLNVAELGDGVFGVGAAARHHFGRDAAQLTAAQAALLAAILPDPRGRSLRPPSTYLRRRQRWILRQMPYVATRVEHASHRFRRAPHTVAAR